MAVKNKTARPAARKSSHTKTKKTVATRTAARRDPIAHVIDRAQPKPAAEPVKLKGELPVPTATFYF